MSVLLEAGCNNEMWGSCTQHRHEGAVSSETCGIRPSNHRRDALIPDLFFASAMKIGNKAGAAAVFIDENARHATRRAVR
jgi:hypothetical protein